ncbi:MAG TPA: flagellar basal-body MS-ring/collar protein FliF [Candidatus Sulfotelmatobacter sp.]|jgi:flagellar M-ring protein FliF|nr:flagellar basal-body MS-ring/collar protein FliF [Candidatus Sulfotelmatobacter sp.]
MNNNFSKLGRQLLEIWNHLGVSQRISVAAATFVLLACLGAVTMWSSHKDYALLYGGLSDAEASKVIAALDDAKVPYKINGGGSISVPSDKVYATRMQLAGKGIPQTSDGVGFEIFDKPNFGISDFVQHANYTRALQGELSRTISQIDEIESARVMIVLPENRLLLDKDKFPTASVFVHVRGNSQLQPSSINSIRFLVANSVEGLKPNHVSVVDNLGNVLSENTDNDSMTGLSTSQLAVRRNLELYLSKKAQDMLEKVVGPGQAIVRVSAEVNYDSLSTSQDKFDPDGQVVRTQTKNDESTDTAATQNTTPTGISGNTVNETNGTAGAAPLNSSKNHKTTSTIEYEIGKTHTDLVQAAGGIKRLTAAITVAMQMDGTGTDRKTVPRSPEELDKLKRIVTNALGADLSRGDTVELDEMQFNDMLATDLTQQLDTQQKRDFWMTLLGNSAYPALAVLALFILFRAFKRTPMQDIPLGVPVGRIGHHTGNGNGRSTRPSEITFEPQPGVVTVDVLNRLIRENPNNMTAAIRDWMHRGTKPE